MKPRLRNRNLQIPNGLRFYLPQVKWRAPTGASFNSICDGLMRVIRANPAKARQFSWPLDRAGVEDWVDETNALHCARNGWNNYIYTDAVGVIPKVLAPDQASLLESLRGAAVAAKRLISGAKSLTEYLDSGEPPVTPELAGQRAAVCVECPKNEAGDFTRWFTIPAAALIKRQIQKAQSRQLTTPLDAKLNLCTACHCPLALKVHVPIEWITKRLAPDQLAGLRQGKNCWIIAEGKL